MACSCSHEVAQGPHEAVTKKTIEVTVDLSINTLFNICSVQNSASVCRKFAGFLKSDCSPPSPLEAYGEMGSGGGGVGIPSWLITFNIIYLIQPKWNPSHKNWNFTSPGSWWADTAWKHVSEPIHVVKSFLVVDFPHTNFILRIPPVKFLRFGIAWNPSKLSERWSGWTVSFATSCFHQLARMVVILVAQNFLEFAL